MVRVRPHRRKGTKGVKAHTRFTAKSRDRDIRSRYGEDGIRALNLIDGKNTVEDILKKTGIRQDKLVEMMDYMDLKGYIRLELKK